MRSAGWGPLQPLLDDDRVTEIMVNGAGALFYEEGGRLHKAERVFENDEQILMVIDRILAPLGRRLDERSPIVKCAPFEWLPRQCRLVCPGA
jgi:pilus assembly protein CpaF